MGRIYSLEECEKLPPGQLRSWCYNALDTTGTLAVAQALLPRLTPETQHTYDFERALQNPLFAMTARGVLVDVDRRNRMIADLRRELSADQRRLSKLDAVSAVWDQTEKETGACPAEIGKKHKWAKGTGISAKTGRPVLFSLEDDDPHKFCLRCGAKRLRPKPFNGNSDDQVRHLLYDLHKVPPMRNKKGDVSVDEEVLDRIGRKYPAHKPLSDAILAVRDKVKQLGTLQSRLSADNRWHASFYSGPWTGRLASSKDPFRRGNNLQNVAERHRSIFVADPGMDLFYADLKTAESMVVAYLAGDEAYIEAHKDDVHTFVTILVWPDELPWIQPWPQHMKENARIAKGHYPPWDNVPGHDYRFQSKSTQHGSNFMRTARGIALEKHVPVAQAQRAQDAYFHHFPFIRGWQHSIKRDVEEHQPLVTPLGFQVTLFGRPWDVDTIRQGVSYKPQGTVANIINLALLRVWWELEPLGVQPLAQVHDAILGQFPRGRRDLLRRVAELMRIPVDVTDYRGQTRRMIIPVEIAVGSNWGHRCISTPERPCKGGENRYGIEEVEV